jgi:hypothetical protein
MVVPRIMHAARSGDLRDSGELACGAAPWHAAKREHDPAPFSRRIRLPLNQRNCD